MNYDANGNLIQKAPPSDPIASDRYTYDLENHLTQVMHPKTKSITLNLQPGWNFISLPVIPLDTKISAIFSGYTIGPGQPIEQIAKYDPVNDTFLHFGGSSKFDQFQTLDYGTGYQVYCNQAVSLTLTGLTPTQQKQQALGGGLSKGNPWHLIPSVETGDRNLTIGALLKNVPFDPKNIFRYDALKQSLQPITPNTTAAIGEAYYIKLTRSATWTLPMPVFVRTNFTYDGDGGRVTKTDSSGTTTYLGESYEIRPTGDTVTHLFAGSQRTASLTSNSSLQTSN